MNPGPRRRLLLSAIGGLLILPACVGPTELSTPAAPQIAPSPRATVDKTPATRATNPPSTSPPLERSQPVACIDEAEATSNPWAIVGAEALGHAGFSDVELSTSIWVEGYGEVISHQPDLPLFPASNQKLFTALGALSLLSPDHQFVTTVEASGRSLILRASGDPTLKSSGPHSLVALAQIVAQADGSGFDRLIVDAGRFEPDTTTPGRLDWQLPTYTGPLSAFIVDDNRWRKDEDFITNPALENGHLFAEQLRNSGIAIKTVDHLDHYKPTGPVIASLSSAPVSQLAIPMMMSSDNEIAESLMREIGAGSTADGISAIDNLLAGQCPSVSGESGDGSGLSRANLRSSRDWRELLQLAHEAKLDPALIDLLPVSGQSGTMSQRLTGAATRGKVAAKTGTIIGGRALSGYATTVDGYFVVFSIVTNGEPAAANRSVAAIDNLISAIVRTPTK